MKNKSELSVSEKSVKTDFLQLLLNNQLNSDTAQNTLFAALIVKRNSGKVRFSKKPSKKWTTTRNPMTALLSSSLCINKVGSVS